MNSLCSDLLCKALQSCSVFCVLSQDKPCMYNRGVKVALYRISLINWRREPVLVCVVNGFFTPLPMGDRPIDWDKGEFVSKSPRYRLAAEHKCIELWIFPRFSGSAASGCKLPFASDHLIDLSEYLSIGSAMQFTTKLRDLKSFHFLPSQTGPERHVCHLVPLVTF